MNTTIPIKYRKQLEGINYLVVLLLLIFTSEALFKWFRYYVITDFRIAAVVKISIQFVLMIYLLIKRPKSYVTLGALTLVFLIGQISLNGAEISGSNLQILSKFLFLPILLFFTNILQSRTAHKEQFLAIFEWLIVINSVCILAGVLLEIRLFKTYSGHRFGYSGLIIKSGAATYIYACALFILSHQVFVNGARKMPQLLLVLIASVLLGTKAIFLFLFLLFLFIIWKTKIYRKWYFIGALLLVGAFLFVFNQFITEKLTLIFPSLAAISNQEGFITMLTSYRNVLFYEEFLPLVQEKWNVLNYLFGGSVDMHYRSQFELFDLLYFFGIVGAFIYLYTFFKEFISFKQNYSTTFFIISILLLAAISGNFFYNAVVAIYLVVIKCYFELNELKETS